MCLWVLIPKCSGRKKHRMSGPQKKRRATQVSFAETSGLYLQTLDGGEERERQGEGRGRAQFAQLSPWCSAPVDGSGVAHLQHQVHGSLAATTRSRNAVSLDLQHGASRTNSRTCSWWSYRWCQRAPQAWRCQESSPKTVWCLRILEPVWGRRATEEKKRLNKVLIWWLIPFFAAGWSEASPSPRGWSSRRCPACRSPSRPWWPRPSPRTLASASGSTDTAGCPWAAGRTFSRRCIPWKRNTEWRGDETSLSAAPLWRRAAFTLCLWTWPCWALWRCTSWTAPERLSPWTWARW